MSIGSEAATGAAVGAAVGSALEVVPVLGPALHAAATALGALGGAISGAARDTFHPTPAQAEAWLTLFRLYPALTMMGVDNEGEPHRAARLVRYFRIVSGEVPTGVQGNTGELYNPSDERCDNPYMCQADAAEVLTSEPTLRTVHDQLTRWQQAGSDLSTLPQAIPSLHPAQADAAALLDLIRRHPAPFQDLSTWDTFKAHRNEIRVMVRDARRRAGECGPDASTLLSGLFGDVSLPDCAPLPPGAAVSGVPGGRLVVQRPAGRLLDRRLVVWSDGHVWRSLGWGSNLWRRVT